MLCPKKLPICGICGLRFGTCLGALFVDLADLEAILPWCSNNDKNIKASISNIIWELWEWPVSSSDCQRTTCGSQFWPAKWLIVMELRSSGLVESVLTYWNILQFPIEYIFVKMAHWYLHKLAICVNDLNQQFFLWRCLEFF